MEQNKKMKVERGENKKKQEKKQISQLLKLIKGRNTNRVLGQ